MLVASGMSHGFAAHSRPESQSLHRQCIGLFAEVDALISRQGIRDHGPFPVDGFPFLRINRFLASFANELESPERRRQWIEALAALDREARGFELANQEISRRGEPGEMLASLDDCRGILVNEVLGTPERMEQLRYVARAVPDEYMGSWRLLGLYPLTALAVRLGISMWHEEIDGARQTVLPAPARSWRGHVEPDDSPSGFPDRVLIRKDALGIPRPERHTLKRLFDHFSPRWRVGFSSQADLIGRPEWGENGIGIDTSRPAEYRLLSYTRFGGETLLQLNYVIWFPARAGDDLYSGRVDGLNLRVTLDADGHAMIYDIIHNCGCYQTYFPGPALLRRQDDASDLYLEPPLIYPVRPGPGVLEVQVSSGKHYVVGLRWRVADVEEHRLEVRDYQQLRSLPIRQGLAAARSMFGEHGIVAGSERRERYLLWVMGVRSPGAMRQWGHHAIAFVGRRHFDDPDLLERLFVRADKINDREITDPGSHNSASE